MDNCGGGQRLPPDGDEFPAAYHEFTNSGQYQFVTSANITTMASNGNLVCQNQTYVASENFQVHPKNNKETIPNEKIQMASECVVDFPSMETEKHYISDFDPVKRSGNYSNFNPKPVVISEKKIEIAGYYPKEVPSVDSISRKDGPENPPPLPLTEPPKIDSVTSNRNNSQPSPRKFSFNGELWRQDDKSERSVRDKIAMFSSQSSLEVPVFPNTPAASPGTSSRRLLKHKSSDDVFVEDKITHQKEFIKSYTPVVERAQSTFDLSSTLSQSSSLAKFSQRPPSLPKSFPPSEESEFLYSKPASQSSHQKSPSSPETKEFLSTSTFEAKPYSSLSSEKGFNKSFDSNLGIYTPKSSTPVTIARATSFSGGIMFNHERPQTSNELLAGPQISRTNSLASTFRKPNEDMRRNSLNQLIEQRRKGISKLRGLVIPEKDTVPVDQPIIDLPEIKSRDFMLVNQVR